MFRTCIEEGRLRLRLGLGVIPVEWWRYRSLLNLCSAVTNPELVVYIYWQVIFSESVREARNQQ